MAPTLPICSSIADATECSCCMQQVMCHKHVSYTTPHHCDQPLILLIILLLMIHLLLPTTQRLSSLLCIFLISNRRMPVLWHAITAPHDHSLMLLIAYCSLPPLLLTHLALSLTNTTTTTTASSSVANGAVSVTAAVSMQCLCSFSFSSTAKHSCPQCWSYPIVTTALYLTFCFH
jgi:hypothetical protein